MPQLEDKYAQAAQEDRSGPRDRTAIPATLRPAGARSFQTVVRDLSLSGFSAAAINEIRPRTNCWLTLPDMEAIPALAVWWDNGTVGCAFDNLLDNATLDTLLERWRDWGRQVPNSNQSSL